MLCCSLSRRHLRRRRIETDLICPSVLGLLGRVPRGETSRVARGAIGAVELQPF